MGAGSIEPRGAGAPLGVAGLNEEAGADGRKLGALKLGRGAEKEGAGLDRKEGAAIGAERMAGAGLIRWPSIPA